MSKRALTPKEKLLARLPASYRCRVADLTEERDLVDDCKYLLTWTARYTDGGKDGIGASWPVKSISEAVEFVKSSLYEVE